MTPSCLVLAGVLLLSGCATDRIRSEAKDLMLAGQYEQAVVLLETGAKEHPEATALRAGLLQAKAQAIAQLVAQAAIERSAGRIDAAERLLQRAIRLEGDGGRVSELLLELDHERRAQRAVARARTLSESDPAAALIHLQQALRDSPRNQELLAMRRKLEAAARTEQYLAITQGLTESRPVSLDFRDVNLRTLLDVVTRNSGVNFILDQDVRRDIQVSVYLNSVRVEEAIDLIASTHGLAKKVLDGKTILIYPNTQEKRREYQEQVVRLFHLSNADAKSAATFLKSMLRIRDPFVDERSNFIALREAPENIALAERLLAMYDTPEPEVVLELEVMEISTSRLLDLGVRIPDAVTLTPLGPGGSSGGLTLESLANLRRSDVGVSLGSVLLNLRREAGDYNTLANPKIRARNKEKARVLVGDKVPVVTTTTGQGGFVSDSVNYLDVGLKLEIQPTVYADNEVAMTIALEVSSVSKEVPTTGGGLAYEIGTRNAQTTLRLRDGETQVLAGLLSRAERSTASRIPGLGDLPVAGRLFSNQRDDSRKTELVLAITPRVVRNISVPQLSESEIWIGTESNTRLRSMGGRPTGGVASVSADRPPVSVPQLDPREEPGTKAAGSLERSDARLASPSAIRWAAPATAVVGAPFSVGLELDGPGGIAAVAASLTFDPRRLRLVAVDEGMYLKKEGAGTRFSKQVDEQQGAIQLGISRQGGATAAGGGRLVELRFVATEPGPAAIRLLTLQAIAGTGDETPANLPPPLNVEVVRP